MGFAKFTNIDVNRGRIFVDADAVRTIADVTVGPQIYTEILQADSDVPIEVIEDAEEVMNRIMAARQTAGSTSP
jgi:hypothetical protein